jgi:hypothetical protein
MVEDESGPYRDTRPFQTAIAPTNWRLRQPNWFSAGKRVFPRVATIPLDLIQSIDLNFNRLI